MILVRVRSTALLAALAVIATGAAYPTPAGSDGRPSSSAFDERCQPKGSRLAVANRYARVYYRRGDDTLSYCLPGRRKPELTLLAQAAYPPPAISLIGPYLGYAGFALGPSSDDYVVVVDVRHNNRTIFLGTTSSGVGSLKVSRSGSVAWIICQNGNLSEGRLVCRQPGQPNLPRSVYLHDSRDPDQTPARLLARSTRIEIRSLRRTGDRITWRQDGRTKSAPFR